MADSDIFMRQRTVRMVVDAVDSSEADNPGGGGVHVATDKDGTPGLVFDPGSGSARFNGPEGLGEVFITTDGENESRTRDNRVWIDGGTGRVELGEKGTERFGPALSPHGWDIRLDPKYANIELGGGFGEYSEGDLKLNDEDGDNRVHLTAESGGGQRTSTSRAWIDGGSGTVALGAEGTWTEDGEDVADIKFSPGWATARLGGGDGDNSEGDLRLLNELGGTYIHLDAGGGGPYDTQTTSIYANGRGGSLHFRPIPNGYGSLHPMLYMYNSWPSGTADWDAEDFPDERPVIAHSTLSSKTGLVWRNDESKFVFQMQLPPRPDGGESAGDDAGSDADDWLDFDSPFLPRNPSDADFDVGRREGRLRPVLTTDFGNQRVGVNTDDPEHALDVDGTVNADNIGTTSDARCKRDVRSISGCLETIRELRGVSYEWDDEFRGEDFDNDRHLGFIAQEVEEVLPEAVTTGADGIKSTIADAILPVLAEAIDEQQGLIERQRELIDRQRSRLEELEDRVAALEREPPDITAAGESAEANDGCE